MPLTEINDSLILADLDNYTVNGSGQKLMTASGIKARMEELKENYPKLDIIYFPDRDRQRVTDGIYVTNTSGKAKLCPECQEFHLSFNPLDNGGEFSCFSCDKTWKIGEGKASANQNGNGKSRNTMAGRKSAAKNILDPSFVDPATRDDKYAETSTNSKYQYAMASLVSFFEKLGLELDSKEATEFIKDSRHYVKEFKQKKEERENILSQLKLLDVQVRDTEALTISLGESDSSYSVIKGLLDTKTEERDKLREKLAALQ